MGLGVGIVGLPNVGKSTTFNALTKEIEDIGYIKFYFAKDEDSKNSFYFSNGEL